MTIKIIIKLFIFFLISLKFVNISFSKERTNSIHLNEYKNNGKIKKISIFKKDIQSLSLESYSKFKLTFIDLMKIYFKPKTVKSISSKILKKDNLKLKAYNQSDYIKIFPKSKSSTIYALSIIRIIRNLAFNDYPSRTLSIFHLKKKFIFHMARINGVILEEQNISFSQKYLDDTTENFSASLPIPIGLNAVSKIVSHNISRTPFSSVFFGIIGLSATSIDINGSENITSSGSSSFSASDFETTEYNSQYGLSRIGSSYAYARGFNGSGVTVSVLDSPFDTDHPDLSGVFKTGYDASSGGSDVTCISSSCSSSHGTHVSGIIAANKNSTGMHGVAYEAKIKPITIFDSSGSFDVNTGQLTSAISNGSGSAYVAMNNSWGSTTTGTITIDGNTRYYNRPATSSLTTTETNAWESAVSNTVIVWANGNNGMNNSTGQFTYYASANDASNYNNALGTALNASYMNTNMASNRGKLAASNGNLSGKWLTVIALDSSDNIASYSNGCGEAKDFCIGAPGSLIYSTIDLSDSNYSGVNYANKSGTSMAAPHVTAAIAILKQQFPNLTPSELVTLLINSATDLGNSGVDEVYGVGKLNLNGATNPSGTAYVAAFNANKINSGNTNNTGINSSAVFGNTINEANIKIGVLDDYNRSYIWAPNFVKEDRRENLNNLFKILNKRHETMSLNKKIDLYISKNIKKNNIDSNYLKVTYTKDDNFYLIEGLRNFTSNNFEKETQNSEHQINSIYNKLDSKNTISNTKDLNQTIKVKSSATFGKVNEEKISEYSVSLITNEKNDLTSSVTIGKIKENNNALGSSFFGAYELLDGAKSNYISLNANFKIGELDFNSKYTDMITELEFKNKDFARISDLKSNSYEFNIKKETLFTGNDSLSLNFEIPLSLYAGNLVQLTTKGYNSNGDYNSVKENYLLKNNSRQNTISLNYQTNVIENLNLTTLAYFSKNYLGIKNNDNKGLFSGLIAKF